MGALSTFLAATGFKGLRNWIWIAIVAALIAAAALVVAIADRRHENALDAAKDAGGAEAVLAGQKQTLEQLGDANHAAQDLRNAGERSARRYADCLLDSRDKRTCERYNPDTGE